MGSRRRRRSGVIAAVALLVLVVAGLGLWLTQVAQSPSPSQQSDAGAATVERVVDGDTLIVDLGGDRIRVRLLNIDTPETHHPDRPVECLGPEAADYLTRLLPKGTTVRLEFDRDREDRYGRTLAGVFTDDGVLVNAQIAQAGLARPILVGRNDRFLGDVLVARDVAKRAQVGAFSPALSCTLASQFTETPRR